MKLNPFSKRIDGIGPGPGDLAQARIRAMAAIARRAERDLARSDDEHTKDELARKAGRKQQDAILDGLPELRPWNPVPGSSGHHTPEPLGEEEDGDGRSQSEQSADKGSERAQQERIRLAAEQSDRLKS